MARRSSQHATFNRWAAPTAFLAGATIAIVLVASALDGSGTTQTTTAPATVARTTTAAATTTKRHTKKTTAGRATYYTVVAGDTYGTIAEKNDTSVAELERLNPGVSSTSLHIGQKIRVA